MRKFSGFLLIIFLLSVGLLAGGGCKKKKKKFFAPVEGPGANGVVGTAGGTVTVSDPTNPINGASAVFPAGAFTGDVTVNIGQWLQDIEAPDDSVLASEIINITAGEDPLLPFTIILPYRDEDNDGLEDGTNVPEVLLMPYRYEESNSSWVQITKVSQDTSANTVTATSDRLGKFALFGPVIDSTVQPELATNPTPADAATDVPLSVTLGWDFPANTTSFDIYFGLDRSAVETATTASTEFRGNTTTNSIPLSLLSFLTTYYWRVDSVNQSGKTKMSTAWSFTTLAPVLPDQVTNPTPADLAQDISLNQTLAWDPANNAISYDVYIGLTQGAVATADTNSSEFMGNFSTPFYTQPADLNQYTTYYWRIDSRNAAGETNGVVWSFRTVKTLPDQVANPVPSSGATDQPINITLSWDNAALTSSFDVYFGDNATEVANADNGTAIIFQGNQTGLSIPISSLSENTTYYWRVDSLNTAGTTTGQVWSFTTGLLPAVATVIDPADGVQDEEVAQTLQWNNASLATSYDVYLGDDVVAVTNATPATPVIYRGEVFTNSWATPALSETTSYYWRIDSKNAVGTVTGSVWSFQTGILPEPADTPSPADAASNQALSLTLGWNAVNATLSHVYLGDNLSLVTALDPGVYIDNTAGLTMPVGPLSTSTTYYWRVVTENAIGSVSGPVWSFDTGAYPPAAVSHAPGNLAIVSVPSQTLSWNCGGVITDVFDVYFGTNFSDVLAEDTGNGSGVYMGNQSTLTFDPGGLAADTSYYWRVDSVNIVGTTTGVVFGFRTIPLPPQVANLTPADDTTHINTLSLNITWDCGGIYTDQFYVFFSDNQTEVANREAAAYEGNTSSLLWPVSGLSPLTSYYWAVDSNNNFGNTAGLVWDFSPTGAPPAATAVSPADGTTDVIDLTPTLSWDNGASPPPTDQFDLYFSGTKNLVDTLCSSILVQSGAGKSWTAPLLGAGTSYYWRVVTLNGVGNDSGTTWSFDTEPVPLAPVLVSPADGNQWVSTTGPTLDWDCGGINTDLYYVFLGDNLTAVQLDDWSNSLGTSQGSTANTDLTVSDLIPGVDYYWRVQAWGDTGTNSSVVWTFRVTPLPPLPGVYAPSNGNSWISDTNPTLEWSNGGDITDSFDVYFSDDFSLVNSATIISAEFVGNMAANTSAIPPVWLPLVPGTSYYWRVDSVNPVGKSKNAVWSFRVTPLAPAPINLTPANGSWGIATGVVTTWQCGGDLTDGFNVFFGTDMDCVNDATPANGYSEFIDYRTSSSYNPGGLAVSTTYFWRIESVNSMGNTGSGLYWFRTEGPPLLSYNENPGNSSTGINTILTMTWDNDDPTVTDYAVFLGNSLADVAGEDWANSNGTYLGLTGGPKSYTPSQLEENTSYYWRITPVNAYGNSAGGIWWFETGTTIFVTLTSIEPDNGLVAGLTFVNIYGDGFDCTCTVDIGGAPAYGVTFENANWLTCYTPTGTPGCANVFVDRGGLANDSLVGGYAYFEFPGATQVNTNVTETWAAQYDPVALYTANDAGAVFFSDNRRTPIGWFGSGEFFWALELIYGGPWSPNIEQYPAFSLDDVPNRYEPHIVLGPATTLYMTWRGWEGSGEGAYFASTTAIGAPWDAPTLIANTSDLFGTWVDWTKITYTPAELSIFIMSGNDDDITQIRRYYSVDGGATWPSYDNVTDASSILWDMDVAVNPLGGILIIYANVTDDMVPNLQMQCKYYDGVTWNGPYRVDSDPGEIIKGFPLLAAGTDGTFYAAWLDNRSGNLDVYFTKSLDNGATWAPDTPVDADLADTWEMDFFINGVDNLWIGISDTRGAPPYRRLWVMSSTDTGNTWGAPVLAADSGGSDITTISGDALDNGTVLFAGEANNDVYTVTSTDGGATWLPAMRVSDDLDDQTGGAPEDIARLDMHAGTNTLGAIWLTGRWQGVESLQIRAALSTDNGTTWNGDPIVNDVLFLPPEDEDEITGDPVRIETPTLLSNASSQLALFAAWGDGRNTSGSDWEQTMSIYFNWANSSGDWQESPNICITDFPGVVYESEPHLAMDNAGNMLCIWTQYDGPTWNDNPDRIRVARSADYGQTWVDYTYADTNPGTAWRRYPKVIWDGSRGIWVAVWLDSRNGGGGPDYAVFCARSSDGGASWINESQLSISASPASEQVVPLIDPTNDRLYVFWREGGSIAYQFSDDGALNWNASDTFVDTGGWPPGYAESFDVKFTPQGVAQVVIEHRDTWPPTEWRTLLQRGLPGTGQWVAPITVVDTGEADEFVLKNGASVAVRQDNSGVFVIWPDARNDFRFGLNADLFTSSGR